jgi:hypothetical protein
VYLGGTAGDFLAACDSALASDRTERDRRATLMRKVLSGTSWGATVSAMEELLGAAVGKSSTLRASA